MKLKFRKFLVENGTAFIYASAADYEETPKEKESIHSLCVYLTMFDGRDKFSFNFENGSKDQIENSKKQLDDFKSAIAVIEMGIKTAEARYHRDEGDGEDDDDECDDD